ncbi:N-acetylglucosamine-6-phosphate deacetylase [soil metagenome]
MSRFALTGARIFDGETTHDNSALIVEGRRIAGIGKAPSDTEVVTLDGGLLAPGFVDAQVNGGGGALFNGDPTPATIAKIAAAHRKYGTTALLPTVITDRPEILEAAAQAIAGSAFPGVIGIHIEGPFIDVRRKGAHDPALIREITRRDIDWLKGLDCGTIMITLAPSTVPPEIVRELSDAGIIVSLGHAEATATEVQAALAAGARGFTHLYNAMSPLTHRAPGMVGAALADRESWCGIIADGYHADPIALKVAIAAKPQGKVFLVSDAMPTAAGGPASFNLQGRPVRVVSGRLELADGTLAGSNLTMDEAVRYCIASLDVGLEEALRMASLYPAAFLRQDHVRGRLVPGFAADIVHLDAGLEVRNTWIGGVSA